jgi:hypothetical protein
MKLDGNGTGIKGKVVNEVHVIASWPNGHDARIFRRDPWIEATGQRLLYLITKKFLSLFLFFSGRGAALGRAPGRKIY